MSCRSTYLDTLRAPVPLMAATVKACDRWFITVCPGSSMHYLLFYDVAPDVAKRFANAEPYVINGLVTSWRVREWATVVGHDPAVNLSD